MPTRRHGGRGAGDCHRIPRSIARTIAQSATGGRFSVGAAGHGCSAQPCPRPAKTGQTAHASRAGRRGVRLTLLGGANLTHLGPRGARCAFCPAAARLARSAPRIPGKGVPGHICSVGGSGHPALRTGSIAWDVCPSILNVSCTRLQLTPAKRQTMVLQTIAPRRCQRTRARGASNSRPRRWRLAMEPDAGSSRHPLRSGGDGDEDLAQLCRERAGVGGDGDGCRVRRARAARAARARAPGRAAEAHPRARARSRSARRCLCRATSRPTARRSSAATSCGRLTRTRRADCSDTRSS